MKPVDSLPDRLDWGDTPVFLYEAFATDFERLLSLRVRVQREHLERLGRFTPERARARFKATYRPDDTRLSFVDQSFAGCISCFLQGDAWELGHFYIEPEFQSGGLGGVVLQALLNAAQSANTAVTLDVIIGSPAHRFYQRHGFKETHRDTFDTYYRWKPKIKRSPARRGSS